MDVVYIYIYIYTPHTHTHTAQQLPFFFLHIKKLMLSFHGYVTLLIWSQMLLLECSNRDWYAYDGILYNDVHIVLSNNEVYHINQSSF